MVAECLEDTEPAIATDINLILRYTVKNNDQIRTKMSNEMFKMSVDHK